MHNFLQNFNFNQPATNEDVLSFENASGKKLPNDYVDFLKITNGGEGFVGEYYIILWGIDELVSMNQAYKVDVNCPGLLLFGSDGGGESFGFDTRNPLWPIFQVPFIVMIWKDARPISDSFRDFLEQLYSTT